MPRFNLKYLMYITNGEDVTFLGFLKTTDTRQQTEVL
jgi:hypothetical protein